MKKATLNRAKFTPAFILFATLCVSANVGDYCSEDKKECLQLKPDGKFAYAAANKEQFFGTYTVKCDKLSLIFDGIDEKSFSERVEREKVSQTQNLNKMIEQKCGYAATLGIPLEDFNGKRYSIAQIKQCINDYENVKAVKERRAAIKATTKLDENEIKRIIEDKNKEHSSAIIYGNSITYGKRLTLNNTSFVDYLAHKYYCSNGVLKEKENEFTDSRDGKKYKYATIGKQTWMAENLNYRGKDGYLGLCYDKMPENCEKYGRFYDWSEAMGIDRKYNEEKWGSINWPWKKAKNHQGICPEGWHLPSEKEWKTLMDFAGGFKKLSIRKESYEERECRYTTEDDRGRVTKHDECPTDEYGFSANYAGAYDYSGNCFFIPLEGKKAAEMDPSLSGRVTLHSEESMAHGLCFANNSFEKRDGYWNKYTDSFYDFFDKETTHPVRCIKDEEN